MHQDDPRRRPLRQLQQTTRRREQPGLGRRSRHPEALIGARQAQVVGLRPVPPVRQTREPHHTPIGQREPREVVVEGQPGLRPRRPARAERPRRTVQRVVRALQRHQRRRPAERQVRLRLQEVARRRVHRVIRISRRRRRAVAHRRLHRHRRPRRRDVRGPQRRLDRRIRHPRHTTTAARRRERPGHRGRPRHLVRVLVQPLLHRRHAAGRIQVRPRA